MIGGNKKGKKKPEIMKKGPQERKKGEGEKEHEPPAAVRTSWLLARWDRKREVDKYTVSREERNGGKGALAGDSSVSMLSGHREAGEGRKGKRDPLDQKKTRRREENPYNSLFPFHKGEKQKSGRERIQVEGGGSPTIVILLSADGRKKRRKG